MRGLHRPCLFLCRTLVLLALAVSSIAFIAELQAAALTANTERAKNESRRAKSYRWNLKDGSLPLISLPDHLEHSLDLSLTYSMDQFEFPLFQSLYYNQRAGKYILMVIPKANGTDQADDSAESPEDWDARPRELPERRAEFIDLDPVAGKHQFEAKGHANLRLTDKGSAKLLSTSDGAIYTFAPFPDGELHCSQIKDRDGVGIDLKYTSDSQIQTITDVAGRTISFSYTNDYVSSITQTWSVNSAKLRKTWTIVDEVRFAHRPAAAAPMGAVALKRIPSNAIKSTYTQAMSASDAQLATIFGGPGAIAAANGFEPAGLESHYPLYRGDLISDDGKMLRGHLSFAMHLYGSADGRGETEVYIPSGYTSHSGEPSPTDAVVTFYYPRLGKLTDVTLAVFHVANFQVIEAAGRVRIGAIGGRGGSAPCYRHAHLEFYRGDTGLPPLAARGQLRIDPATVFSSRPTIASASKTTTPANLLN